jgi:hypothetical protein
MKIYWKFVSRDHLEFLSHFKVLFLILIFFRFNMVQVQTTKICHQINSYHNSTRVDNWSDFLSIIKLKKKFQILTWIFIFNFHRHFAIRIRRRVWWVYVLGRVIFIIFFLLFLLYLFHFGTLILKPNLRPERKTKTLYTISIITHIAHCASHQSTNIIVMLHQNCNNNAKKKAILHD